MRDYAKISPRFWIGRTGRCIKAHGVETQLVALYLMSCPHATMIGIYYLPVHFIAHETGIPLERAQKALLNLRELQFCSYDDEMEYIFVHEMAFYQVGGALKVGDNRIKGINDDYRELPALSFLKGFYERYKDDFHLECTRENFMSKQAPFKPLFSQDQEQEQDQETEQEQEQEKLLVASTRRVEQKISNVEIVFNHWRDTMQHPNAVLDDKRRRLITLSLKNYTSEQLCQAITGCSYTPHNMGKNEQGQRYDGLHVILRSADQIDRFMRNASMPPGLAPVVDPLLERNIAASQQWLRAKLAATSGDSHAGH